MFGQYARFANPFWKQVRNGQVRSILAGLFKLLHRHSSIRSVARASGSRCGLPVSTARTNPRLVTTALCLVVGVSALGCQGEPALQVAHWTMSVPGQPARQVRLPAHLSVDRKVPFFELRTVVELPEALVGRPLDLVVPRFEAASRLTVDGHPASGQSALYRTEGPRRFGIPPSATEDGSLQLTFGVRHASRQSAWLDTVPRLLPAEHGSAHTRAVYFFNVVLALAAVIALLQIGLTCIGIYLMDRTRRPYLWFGIQALFAAYYPLYLSGATAHLGPVDLLLLAPALAVAMQAGIHFSHAYFELPSPPRFLWGLILVPAALCSLAVWWAGPFWMLDVAAPLVVLLVVVPAGYQVWTGIAHLSRSKDPRGASLLLLSWSALILTVWVDVLAWLGAGEVLAGVRLSTLGLTLFSFFLSLLLSRGHIRSLGQADRLSAELRATMGEVGRKNDEIASLNRELQRQLGDRSAQLCAALSLGDSGSTWAPKLRENDVIQERYRIIHQLGAGGMGAVYEVERTEDGGRFALKLNRELKAAGLARLAREAQIACRVSHENVVRIHDVDVAPAGFVYLVMELAEGPSLRDFAKRRNPLKWTLRVLRQIASGLDALHNDRIVHRDLKPSNILLTADAKREPVVKITDFGISRLMAGEPGDLDVVSRSLASVPSEPPLLDDFDAEGPSLLRHLPDYRARPRQETWEPDEDGGGSAPSESGSRLASGRPAAGRAEERATMPAPAVQPPPIPVDARPRPMVAGAEHLLVAHQGASWSASRGTATDPGSPVARSGESLAPPEATRTDSGSLVYRNSTMSSPPSSEGSDHRLSLTATGQVPGTPAYLAPELVQAGAEITDAVDIFSFGVIAFELFARHRPFEPPVSMMLLDGDIPPVPPAFASVAPQLPTEVARMLDRCLSLDPRRRPSAATLETTLAMALAGVQLPAPVQQKRNG